MWKFFFFHQIQKQGKKNQVLFNCRHNEKTHENTIDINKDMKHQERDTDVKSAEVVNMTSFSILFGNREGKYTL